MGGATFESCKYHLERGKKSEQTLGVGLQGTRGCREKAEVERENPHSCGGVLKSNSRNNQPLSSKEGIQGKEHLPSQEGGAVKDFRDLCK